MVTISRLLIVTIIMLITIYCIVRVKVMMLVTLILVTILRMQEPLNTADGDNVSHNIYHSINNDGHNIKHWSQFLDLGCRREEVRPLYSPR